MPEPATISPLKHESTATLPVMEDFYTIQGEGFYQGCAAYFIRLAGCDVGCVWCDVKESWDASVHPMVSVETIVERAKAAPTTLAVVTGGEPALYDLTALTAALQQARMRTHIETSGVYPLTGEWSWVCFSPKKFKQPDESIYNQADELKVVIYNQRDFEWAEGHAEKVRNDCKLFLQPEWSREKEMLPLMIEYCKANPKWRISLQVHKYMNIP
ncbi:7-carboxy-7-deazaguanine synthase QueE [Oscillatoria amoena NRMC-F 0135]|nr:7-carboxy-7-deazaguanine synthase QueE [Oscillatoria amoena NRMC-F 0135]